MIRTGLNRFTGVNTNYRSDFSARTYNELVAFWVRMIRAKRRAMWRAANG